MKSGIVFRAICLLAFLTSAVAFAEPQSFKLGASSGSFNAKNLGSASSAITLAAQMKLLAFRGSTAWPASAYIGVHEGDDRNNSFQILMIRNRPEDTYLVVGYRVVVDGKEVAIQSLADVPVVSVVKIALSFNDGLVIVRVNNAQQVKVPTPFRKVSPYLSVASADAQFDISQ